MKLGIQHNNEFCEISFYLFINQITHYFRDVYKHVFARFLSCFAQYTLISFSIVFICMTNFFNVFMLLFWNCLLFTLSILATLGSIFCKFFHIIIVSKFVSNFLQFLKICSHQNNCKITLNSIYFLLPMAIFIYLKFKLMSKSRSL